MYEPELKYSGENDNFDFKISIFLELFERSEISEQLFHKAYSTMLSGPALTHYYSTRQNNKIGDSFENLCAATRSHFEGPETKQQKIVLRSQSSALSLKRISVSRIA